MRVWVVLTGDPTKPRDVQAGKYGLLCATTTLNTVRLVWHWVSARTLRAPFCRIHLRHRSSDSVGEELKELKYRPEELDHN